MALPNALKNFNVFADGISLMGQVEEIALPKLARKMDTFQGGGMIAPVDIDLGNEKMEMEITCAGWLREAIKQYGLAQAAGGMWRFAGAYQDDSTGTYSAVEIVTRGRFAEIDRGSAKMGDKSMTKMKASLTYYKESVDGEVKIEIDALNTIFIVNGVDRLAEQRKAIGL